MTFSMHRVVAEERGEKRFRIKSGESGIKGNGSRGVWGGDISYINGIRTVSATATVSWRPFRSSATSSTRGTRDLGGKEGFRPNMIVL